MCYVRVLCKISKKELTKPIFKYWSINYSLDTSRALNPALILAAFTSVKSHITFLAILIPSDFRKILWSMSEQDWYL